MSEGPAPNQLSSEDYTQLINSFAQAVWQTDAQGIVVEDSLSWRAYTGQTLQQWLGEGWIEAVHPDDRKHASQQWQQAVEAQTSLNAEFRLRSPDGGWRWTSVMATAIRNSNGTITKWVGINIDITERKERQTYLLRLSDELRPLPDPIDIQGRAAQLLGEYLGADRAYYVEVREATNEFVVARDWHQLGSPSHARRYPLGDWPMPWLINGKTWVVRDTNTDPAMPDDQRASYLDNDIGAAVVVPLIKQERLVATLVVNQRSPRSWTSTDVSLVEETAERTWAAVERTRAEEALQKSEKQFRLFLTATSDILYRMTADWMVMHSLEGKTFLANTESPNSNWLSQYIPESDTAQVLATFGAAIREKKIFELEHRVVRADGMVGWTFSRAIPLLNQQGEIIEWFGAASDITERKQAEVALRMSEERQRAILESARDYAIFTTDLDRSIRSWNTGAQTILGYSEEAILGQLADIIFTPEDRQRGGPQDEAYRAIRDGRAENERWHMRKGGTRFYGSGVTTSLLDEDGQVIGLLKVMRDLTDQKQAEEALQRSEQRLQKALSIPTVGVLYYNESATFTSSNDAFLRISGFSRVAVESRQINTDQMILPEWIPRTRQALEELKTTGRNTPYEKQLVRPDGSRWWGLFAATQLTATEYVEFVLDITHRKEAEAALLEADRRKDEFLALLAHELRNPMATLSNTLLILELTGAQDEGIPLEPALAMMRREVTQLVRLVDDLIDVSRINQGKITLRLEQLELVELMEKAIDSTLPLIESAHRHLEVNLPTEPLYLRGDAVRLTQVVRNLLSNATKFTREGGHIWLSLERQGNEAILQVRDDGIGIPADQLERIFGLFAQVDASATRFQGGLGLGLTLVSEFIERHGGRVEARSAGLGQGSEFIVYLPISNVKSNESIH